MATAVSVETIRELEPLIRRHAGSAEANGRMAPEVMSALIDAGLFRMWIPAAFGGLEMEPNASLDVMEAVARIDASTGWVVSNSSFGSVVCQFLPPPVPEDLLADPGAVICGSFIPPGVAKAAGQGYVLNGNWAFGSGAHYATSLIALNVLGTDDGIEMNPDGTPVMLIAFLDPKQVTLLDTWHTLGLRATGSTNYTAENLEVAADHCFRLGPWESKEGPFAAPLYRMGLAADPMRMGRVAVGIAQGALDDFVELATTKTPAYTARLTADREGVQERVARAQALVQAARNNLTAAVAEAWAAVQHGPRICGQSGLPLALASVFALDAAVQAVELLYESAGSTAFRDESPLQQRFRDLHTLRQNAFVSWSRYESLGKMILGRPTDWPFYQL